MQPPLSKLDIPVSENGFYAGFSKDVAVGAKFLVVALVVWAVAFPDSAASALGDLNTLILGVFNYWYIYAVAFFLILCLAFQIWGRPGLLDLGHIDGTCKVYTTINQILVFALVFDTTMIKDNHIITSGQHVNMMSYQYASNALA